MNIRLADNSDKDPIIEVIDTVLNEQNTGVCLEDAEADLMDIEASYFSKHRPDGTPRKGAFWVLEDEASNVVGTHAAIETETPGVCEFKRLYMAKHLRGSEWGHRLMQNNINWAKENGLKRIEFWSDVRFERAHKFFDKFGFQRSGEIRTMNDSHETYREYFYYLDLIN